MVHISGMQKNVLLENKKLENVSECGLRSAGGCCGRCLDRFAELQGIKIYSVLLSPSSSA